jgi:hypothetical protein
MDARIREGSEAVGGFWSMRGDQRDYREKQNSQHSRIHLIRV